jgi:hypothetical protein
MMTLKDMTTRFLMGFTTRNRKPSTTSKLPPEMKLEVVVARYWGSVARKNRKA